MTICICHRVSDRDIARAACEGCASFDDLQFELSVATSCGKCHDCARETFRRHADATPMSAPAAGACGAHGHGASAPVVFMRRHGALAATGA